MTQRCCVRMNMQELKELQSTLQSCNSQFYEVRVTWHKVICRLSIRKDYAVCCFNVLAASSTKRVHNRLTDM